MSAAEAASLFVGKPAAFYIFFATIEIACTLLIAWFAWRWNESTAAATANS
jgi:low affinity Fe/Cu permease